MTWPKMLALALLAVACTERIVEAITGRGDPSHDRARRKPPLGPLPPLDHRRLAATLRDIAAEVRREREEAAAAAPVGASA